MKTGQSRSLLRASRKLLRQQSVTHLPYVMCNPKSLRPVWTCLRYCLGLSTRKFLLIRQWRAVSVITSWWNLT